ncbi:unnamed protein product [Paramecium sonneborni]|uniref:Uncharacterized protein n=1 Tax=Paramecium sonneborni TaxID=65129 RepID=A0A8S1L8L3_9CILI|nr:unnamed protein product [Paramecium sonneborni]
MIQELDQVRKQVQEDVVFLLQKLIEDSLAQQSNNMID